MKILITLSALFAICFSFIKAGPGSQTLVISSPVSGTNFVLGEPISIIIENGNEVQTPFINALVTFVSPCGSFNQLVPVGSIQTLNLPYSVIGQTTISAQSGLIRSESVQVFINPAKIPSPDSDRVNSCVTTRANNVCQPRAPRIRRGCRLFN